MKNRLLEDIDDSQSGLSAPAGRPKGLEPRQAPADPAAQAPQPGPRHTPSAAPVAPVAPSVEQARQRAGVWRSRDSVPPQPARAPCPPVPPFAQPQAQPQAHAPAGAPPMPERPRAAAGVAPDVASFASRQPDWAIPLAEEPLPWMDRWGRKVLGWTVGTAAVLAIAGAATWMVRETRVEATLAVVAGSTPPAGPASTPATGVPVVPDVPDTSLAGDAPAEPPPLKLLQPAPGAPAPAPGGELPATGTAAAGAALADAVVAASAGVAAAGSAPGATRGSADGTASRAAPVVAAPDGARKQAAKPPAASRAREQRVAADGSPARSRAGQVEEKSAPKRNPEQSRERLAARTADAPARPAPRPVAPPAPPAQPPAEGALSETLRLCRAAGYHATACIKRGCEATRFGLVCRG
ncbi:hypothetical protein [Massilia consociata]|uniref:Meckel syndrome type 1 protein n=1 Tax=Massilia consociata TaxID=760117 RepID=A0ABV6FF49_9BURK